MKTIFNLFNIDLSAKKAAPTLLALVAMVLTLLLSATFAYAQVSQVSASVDRNTIIVDESLTLTLVVTGSVSRDAADFSALQEHFRVSTPSFSQSTQIINGDMTRTVSWSVNLYPKSEGAFTIPSFTIDQQSSRPFNVLVLPLDATNDQPREYFVSAVLDNDNIYLQQQLLYTVKIHLSQDIQRGQLSLPILEGAVVEQIGEDQDYQDIIDGVRYRIIERKYAIIPQSSGDFTIKGPIFEAEVVTNSRRSFANFGRTKSISRRAPDLAITVKAMPANYNYTWLPSELVEIAEEWQGDVDAFTVGEPITRTITLTAMGLTKEQLPSIDLPYHPSFKVYPEQPSLATVQHSNKLIAQGVFNSAIIPEQAGSFVLPEVRIPWFNVNSGQTDFAIVPARTVQVSAQSLQSEAKTQSNPKPLSSIENPTTVVASPTIQTVSNNDLNWLHYLLIATNIFTLILLYVLWLMRRNTKTKSLKQMPIAALSMSEEQAYAHLTKRLQQANTDGLAQALNKWLIILFKDQHYSISASLGTFPSTGALDEYNKLLACQYSAQTQQVDTSQFGSALSIFRKKALESTHTSVLQTLYPQ